jgi:hypothetical protein
MIIQMNQGGIYHGNCLNLEDDQRGQKQGKDKNAKRDYYARHDVVEYALVNIEKRIGTTRVLVVIRPYHCS